MARGTRKGDPHDPTALPNVAVEDEDAEDTRLTNFGNLGRAPDSSPSLSADACAALFISGAVDGESSESNRYYVLSAASTVIGRSVNCALRIDEVSVSREHARIFRDGDDYLVEDCGSARGTFLNGKRIEGRYRLRDRDRLRIGSTILRFEWTSSDFPDESTSTRHAALADWTPTSWRSKPQVEIPAYDPSALKVVSQRLASLPPLVTSWDIERLRVLIDEAQRGERFFLQGGDCTETLDSSTPEAIGNTLKVLTQMSLLISHATRRPVVRVARIAGQYARPRGAPTETRDGVTLPAYQGDLVNRPEFTPEARKPDPNLLLLGYRRAALTLNFMRALGAGGFSAMRRLGYFDLDAFDSRDPLGAVQEEFARMTRQVAEGLHFARAVGEQRIDELARFEMFTSHDALNLEYDSAQTSTAPYREGWYCRSTHFPWVGLVASARASAHIEFLRGIENPVGVKIGPRATPEDLITLIRILNPEDKPGKLVLITRVGAGSRDVIPPLLDAVRRSRRRVLWVCDPMHANESTTQSGSVTRRFDAITQEIEETFAAHDKCGTTFGGLHLELTSADVRECVGGSVDEAELQPRTPISCDPRLNQRQALTLAFTVAQLLEKRARRRASSRPPSRQR